MVAPYRWRDDPRTSDSVQPGAIVLSAFPSAGLAATVAAHYMIRALGLPRVATLESDDSPPLAIIQQGHVQPSIRVYGRKDLAIVMSEFPPLAGAVRPLTEAILDGAERLQARYILAIEGVVPHPLANEEGPDAAKLPEEQVWGVVADDQNPLLALLQRAGVRPLTDGVIGGVTGALLVRSQSRKVPVGALLVSAKDTEIYPDHRAGAALIEVVDRVLPDVRIDTGPLRTQAEMIERTLRAAMKGQSPTETSPSAPSEDARTIYQ